MKKSLLLMQQRGAKVDRLKAINAAAEARENKNLTEAEETEVTEIRTAISSLDEKIKNAKFMESETLADQQRQLDNDQEEQRNRQNLLAGQPTGGGEAKEKREQRLNFSFAKVIKSKIEGRQLEGLEAEVIQEGHREAQVAKRSINGIAIPSYFVKPNNPEQRAQSVGTSTQSGALVATEIGEVIEYLHPRTVLREMGATFLTGLTSNFDMVRQDGAATATWEGENDANANTDPTVENVQLRPKRLGASTIIGKQLAFQTNSIDVENWIRNELNVAQGVGLETAAINGSGTAPIPTGLLNISNIGDVPIGTNGGAPTYAHIVDLETEIFDNNADVNTMAYLTTAVMRGKLKQTQMFSGTNGMPIWSGQDVNGYRAFTSTLVPKTLTKGTSTDCHAIIFGNWAELYIAQWDGLDIVVDPYTLAANAQIKIIVNGWYDINVRHPKSFAAVQDARNV